MKVSRLTVVVAAASTASVEGVTMTMTENEPTTDISVQTLQAMLDGGDENDWLPICRARPLQDGKIALQLLSMSGEVLASWELQARVGEPVIYRVTVQL